MASSPHRKQRASEKEVPAGGSSPSLSRPAYRQELFPDGSVRAVRLSSRREREKGQALADFYGVGPALSTRAHVRSMDGILAEVVERLHLQQADFAPEILALAWEKAVGPFLAARAELQSVANQTARVCTAHPAVRYELRRLRPHIIRALNGELGEGSVQRLTVVHG